jgi:putative sigma-54 modulation protein
MQIKVIGRHTDVKESLKSYAEEKAAKLGKFYDRLHSVDVIFDIEAGSNRCEMIASGDHHTTFIAKEGHQDAFAALDAAAKDLERQITRHKEKFRNRKHTAGRPDKSPLGGPVAETADDSED